MSEVNDLNLSTGPVMNMTGTHHYLQPYSMTHLYVTLVILGTIILLAIVGNVFVMAAVILERNLRTVAKYFVISLAVADLMVATLDMPLAAVNEVSQRWFMGKIACDIWVSFDVLCCTCFILHLVAISLDRYWAVTRVDYIPNRSGKRILAMVGTSWALSAMISIPPLFIQKDPSYDPNKTGECVINQDPGYTVYSTVGAFYLPFILMMIIYLRVFLAARSRIRRKRFRDHYACSRDLASTTVDGGSVALDSPTEGTSMIAVNNIGSNGGSGGLETVENNSTNGSAAATPQISSAGREKVAQMASVTSTPTSSPCRRPSGQQIQPVPTVQRGEGRAR